MKTIEDYNNAFVEVFGVDASALNADFSKETVEEWDSVHQLNIIAQLEESFDIMLDPEDIMEFTSYEKGKAILSKYEVVL
jgi:acyl carrier protein